MRRHRTDVLTLVTAILALGVSVMWGLLSSEALSPADLSVAGPVLLVCAGLAGLLASFADRRRADDD